MERNRDIVGPAEYELAGGVVATRFRSLARDAEAAYHSGLQNLAPTPCAIAKSR
jgi:hypothetical protein